MTDLATVTKERDKLAAENRLLKAEQQVSDHLIGADLPAHLIPYVRRVIIAKGITWDEKGAAMIGYRYPADAVAEYVQANGAELKTSFAKSIAGQRDGGLEATGPRENKAERPTYDANQKTITRSEFGKLSVQDKAVVARRAGKGELTIID